ncbi:MAG: PBP1A family penicillin-binding protein [Vicinamibacterales bacterium]|nr:PBP1A family penicillin-binding protein [Vicinamibacterales bacterium]
MPPRKPRARRGRRPLWRRVRRVLLALTLLPLLAGAGLFAYYYPRFAAVIDERLHGERDRVIPRVFARPLTLHTGQFLSNADLIQRLNDLGYAERPRVQRAGEFTVESSGVVLMPRGGDHPGTLVRVRFEAPAVAARAVSSTTPPPAPERLTHLDAGGAPQAALTLEAPMLTALVGTSREKRRRVALDVMPAHLKEAVLAIEDRRFYGHPGIDPIRIAGALVTNMRGDLPYLVGASTITQQLTRNFFLTEEMALEQQTRERSLRRKLLEQFMAVILETRATKDQILELYLNEVYLGHRGSFALHGVAEASRMFYGKDLTNLSLAEAALLAGVIQSPGNHSPFTDNDRARERRNVVLRAMADAGYLSDEAATRAMSEPVTVVARALDFEAPYFIDYLGQALQDQYPGLTTRPGTLDVHTTLDLNLQRYAQAAVRDGLARVDAVLQRRRPGVRAQAALVAVDPRTGEVLALEGGRSYNQSQFNRAIHGRRQPGSVFKPFVYLAAFERAAAEGRADLTPATMVWDEPTTWTFDDQEWSPRNYENSYDGHITLRRALALSKNIAAIKVAEQAGFDQIVALWKRIGVGRTAPEPYPSIALGVFEWTPFEVAEAYTLFPNGGATRALTGIARVLSGTETLVPDPGHPRVVARPETTFLVTQMMRSVLNEGSAISARVQGFTADAAGKTGTTNDVRDAWFVGFTPELLTVVWVGFDDNQPLGLSGSQAALPIWTDFMRRALEGRPGVPFEPPPGVSVVEIDRDTGLLALPTCPRVIGETFFAGTEPLEYCTLHAW